ncbi:hypothetical protein [Lactobacillus phage JCL1032]|uniref:hypothetical protein n=1 Tax=Lactobacillus phage JCL1032 TaxID=37105 RepID=UPI000217A9E5|nr:hypothetical protein F367_gp22 [Lactobacillus phage JCL1032]ACB72543.1 hypothetical protein [Lactobacillus phage JCL1032]
MRFGLQMSHEMAYNPYGCKCDASVTLLFFQSHFHRFQWLLVYTTPPIKAWTSEGRPLRKNRNE